MDINLVIRRAMQSAGQVDAYEHSARVLAARQEITGADRKWAERYDPGDVVRYAKGSKTVGLDAGEYARVEHVTARDNHVTVTRDNGERVTYDPRRLQGVTLYREMDRTFAKGDRVQLTAPDRERHMRIVNSGPSTRSMRAARCACVSIRAGRLRSRSASIPISITAMP